MNADEMYSLLESKGYVVRSKFAELIGTSDGGHILATAKKWGVRVITFKVGEGRDRAAFCAEDAGKCRVKSRAKKPDEPLPLMKFGEQEEQMRREFEEFRQWKKSQTNA